MSRVYRFFMFLRSPVFATLSNRGFSLIEAAVVLGVIGLIIGGIWTAAASVMERQRMNEMFSNASILITNLRRVSADLPPGVSTQLVNWVNGTGPGVAMGLVPAGWVSNGVARSTYGGFIGIDYYGSRNFQIMFQGPGFGATRCFDFTRQVAFTLRLSGSISPGGQTFAPTRTSAQIMSACSGGVTVMYLQIPD